VGDAIAPHIRARRRRLGVTLCAIACLTATSAAYAGEDEDAARKKSAQRLLKVAAKAL